MRRFSALLVIAVAALPAEAIAQPPTPAAVTAPSAAAITTTPAAAVAVPAAVAKTVVPPLEPQGYTYAPGGRRDPFVSLTHRGADAERNVGPRAAGLAGLGTAEITLKGIVDSRDGFVAIVKGADNKTYIVRSGEKLLDGSIRTITADAMIVLQQVNDPLSSQKQREVRKMLRQTEEAR
jgi:Tfp pilus assembly protein PilP